MPDGLETDIGEKGVRLSAGQKQRLALARAFLRDAPLVVLDEPAASLDLVTEQALLRSINDLKENKTLVVISHRLNVIEQADRVLVMKAGRIIEEGRHRNLLEGEGYYSHLVKAYSGVTE